MIDYKKYKKLENYCSQLEFDNMELLQKLDYMQQLVLNFKAFLNVCEMTNISSHTVNFIENNRSYFGNRLTLDKIRKIDHEIIKIISETYEAPETIEDYKRLMKQEKYQLKKFNLKK